MIEGLQRTGHSKAQILAVVLHGWGGSPSKMRDVIDATRAGLEPRGGVDVYAPRLPYAFKTSSVRTEAVVVKLLNAIDQIIAERGDYKRIVFIGFSLGAVIARRLFLVAAGNPPGFRCEMLFQSEEARPRAWASLVDRLVTINAFNHGWQATGRMGWLYSFWFNFFGLLGHLSPTDELRPTIFDIRAGAPFIVQTRLNWLAYRRFHGGLRSGVITKQEDQALPVARTQDPIVIQLLGSKDDLASPFDQVDIAVDGHDSEADPARSTSKRRYFLIDMKNTDHEHGIIFSDGVDGEHRKTLFLEALTQPPDRLDKIARDPKLLGDELPQIDPEVTDTVFVIHGIRDDGFWTLRIAKEVREHAKSLVAIRARTPTYGYFAMLPFILPWIRRQKVEWLMDQYVSAKAQFPNTAISYVGHSNGTYLAARGLRDYPAADFKHVFFAGSVVRPDYDWLSLVRAERVRSIHNVRAAADRVVALLPKSVEYWKKIDLGGAGFDGFNDAGKHPSITQPKGFANGGHSAAIIESQWPHIAKFIIDGTVPPELPSKDFVPSRAPWLVRFAQLHLGLPLLVLIFGLGFPFFIGWLLWPVFSAPGILALAAYFLLLKFFITRF